MKSLHAAVAFAGLVLCAAVSAQEAPSKPRELDGLRQYVGGWTSDITSKPAAWDHDGTKFRTVSQAEWILDGWFLQHIEVSQVVGDPDKVTKSLILWTFDPESKKYVAWVFHSNGDAASWTGGWDSMSKVFTLASVEPPPNTTGRLTEQFPDAKTINGSLMFIGDGKTLLDMAWTRKRQADDEGKATSQRWSQIGTPTPPVPNEIKKLQPLIGEWDSKITTGTGPLKDPSSKWTTSKGTMSIQSILDGRFLQVTTEHGDNRFIWVIGYDSDNQRYRRITFTNAGQLSVSHGQWNGEFGTIDWKAINERPGPRKRGEDYIGLDAVALGQGNEILKISNLSYDAKGTLYQDFGSSSTRRK